MYGGMFDQLRGDRNLSPLERAMRFGLLEELMSDDDDEEVIDEFDMW